MDVSAKHKVLLTSANNGLQLAEKEVDDIYDNINNNASEYLQAFKYKEVNRLANLMVNHEDITIFHFSGHASGNKLEFLRKQLMYIENIAGFITLQKDIKLVFLNACSTGKMVEKCMQAGAKAVIATSKDVGDEKAYEFATKFYERIIKGDSIELSYRKAGLILTIGKEKKVPDPVSVRGLVVEKENKELNWGLYVSEEHREEVLNWKPCGKEEEKGYIVNQSEPKTTTNSGSKYKQLLDIIKVAVAVLGVLISLFLAIEKIWGAGTIKSWFYKDLDPELIFTLKEADLGVIKQGKEAENVITLTNVTIPNDRVQESIQIDSIVGTKSGKIKERFTLETGTSDSFRIEPSTDLLGNNIDTIKVYMADWGVRDTFYEYEVIKILNNGLDIDDPPPSSSSKFKTLKCNIGAANLEISYVFEGEPYSFITDAIGYIEIDIPERWIRKPELSAISFRNDDYRFNNRILHIIDNGRCLNIPSQFR